MKEHQIYICGVLLFMATGLAFGVTVALPSSGASVQGVLKVADTVLVPSGFACSQTGSGDPNMPNLFFVETRIPHSSPATTQLCKVGHRTKPHRSRIS